MKVLGILSSPRREGNSELLLDQALAGAQAQGAETEKVVLYQLKINPCDACDECATSGECHHFQDDMGELYQKLREADAIILASPLYFLGLTAQTKALIDRCQCLWVIKYVMKRPVAFSGRKRRGLFIGVGHFKGLRLFDAARTVVKAFFATLDVIYEGEVLGRGLEKRGEVAEHPELLEQAFQAGARLARPPD